MATLFLLLVTASAALAQTTVTAQWDRNTDSQTAGYRLYYGTAPGSYQWSVDAGNQTSAPITLSTGTAYYFTVRAYDANFEYGLPSNEASIDLRQGSGGGGGTAAPTAQVTATLQSATTALVTWQTANASTVTLNGSPLGAASGSASVNINGTTTFTLVATNAAGAVATHSATVTLNPPPTSGLSGTITASMQTSNTALVTWQTANASRATINGSPLNAANGTASVYVTGSTTFTLVVWDASGASVTRSATVNPGGAPTSSLTAEITATMQTANTALVTWQTANATRATLNGSTLNAASGTTSVYVSGTTTFTLVASDATGASVTRSATVTLSGSGGGGGGTPPANGPTAQITATMQGSNTAIVTWFTANATRATINGSPLNAASGTASVYVSGSTTFTLVATNAAGVVTTQSATVNASGGGGSGGGGGSTSGATAEISATLQSANTAILTWRTANATRATLNGSPLNAATGTASVYVNGPTTFTLVAWDAAGVSVTRTATVNGTGETPASGPTAQITAVKQSANTVVVTWQTANATRATLNGSPLNAASGTASYWVNGTITFTLVATDANGVSVTRSATVQ